MGLLDQFGSLNEDQTQGLLAAAAQMLQQSGPSRSPVGFGQVVGGGLQAYQGSMLDAKKRKQEQEQAAQMAQLRGLQIQEAQGGLADHDQARKEAERYRTYLMGGGQGAPAGQATPMPPSQPASAMLAPSLAGQSMQPPPTPQAPAGPAFGSYEYMMAKAQDLMKNGFPTQAQAMMKEAVSSRPKFANEPRTVMGPNNKPMLVQMADDGTVRPIEGGYGLAEKLHFQDTGGGYAGLGEYSGDVKTQGKKTMTPGESANLAQSERHFQAGQGKPIFNAEAGGFVTLPTPQNPGGSLIPLAGLPGKPLTESQGKALTFYARMTDAEKSIQALEKNGVSGKDLGTIAAGNNWTNFLASPAGQDYRQAQENWVTANLRQESGAAIGVDEMAKDVRKYFPVPGDAAPVIAQKARARAIATQGMRSQAGRNGGDTADKIVDDAQKTQAAPSAGQNQPPPKSLLRGQTYKGFRFLGGDPAQQSNWEKM